MTAASIHRLPCEIAHRAVDGLEVSLLWSQADDRLSVVVVDARLEDSFEFTVERSNALDAFHHPYAYAAHRGIAYRAARHDETALAA